jgi:SAM-dependent methyltransferase
MTDSTKVISFTYESAEAYAQLHLTGLYLHASRIINRKLAPMRQSISLLVDFGCGAGKSTRAAADCVRHGGSVLGVDTSAEMLEQAERLQAELQAESDAGFTDVSFEFRRIANGTIPLATDAADAIITSYVLQEIQSEAELGHVLEEMGRVTRPRGTLVAVVLNDRITCEDFVTVTYNFPENRGRTDNIRRCQAHDAPITWGNDRHWSREIYVQLLTRAGFEIQSVEYPLAQPSEPPDPARPEILWKDELTTAPAMVLHARKA